MFIYKKISKFFIIFCLIILLVGCTGKDDEQDYDSTEYQIYLLANDNGYTNDYESWKNDILNEEIKFKITDESIEWEYNSNWNNLYLSTNEKPSWYDYFLNNYEYEQYYTVTFVTNSNESIESKVVLKNGLLEEITIQKEDYIFDGWYENNSKFDFSTPITKTTILEAKWSLDESYKETIDYQIYLVCLSNDYSKTYLEWVNDILNEEIKFKITDESIEWEYNSNWNNLYLSTNEKPSWYDYFLNNYEYEQYYIVTFVTNSNESIESKVVLKNGLLEEITIQKEDYIFEGWYENNSKFDFSTPITKTTILEAKWEIAIVFNGFEKVENCYYLEVDNDFESIDITKYITSNINWEINYNTNTIPLEIGTNEYLITCNNKVYTLIIKRLNIFTVTYNISYMDSNEVETITEYIQENSYLNKQLQKDGYIYSVSSNYFDKVTDNVSITVVYETYYRQSLSSSSIFISYENNSTYLLDLNYAYGAELDYRYFVNLILTNENGLISFTKETYQITITIKNGNNKIVSYDYFDYDSTDIWSKMPKYIGEYTIEVDVIELIDGFIFNTILQDFTINAIDFDITDVNGNINQDVKNQIAENAGGAGGFLNIEDDIRDTLDDLLVASYFNQTIWGANTAYIKDGEFELIYEFSSNGIYFGGTYTVTITLIAANYNVATVTCEFFIQTLSTLEDGRALFNDGSGVSSTIDYFSGSTYVIDLSTNVNYLKLPYLQVIISIKNADDSTTAFSSTYNYNEATNDQVWAAMPKFVGKYVVTVTVIETIGDTDYTTTSTTNVEIYGKLTNEIKENTANIEQALDGFVTKEGAELYTSILEKLTVDLFVLSKTVYVVDWNDNKTLQVVVGLYELSMDDFTIVIRDEAGNVVTSITENGTFFVTVIYNGYSNGNIYTAYTYDYQIMFEVTPRITLDSEGVESTVLFYTSRNITSDNIDYYNNGLYYFFMIDTLTAFNNQTPILVLNNHVITVTMVDADGKTYEFTYYDPYFATTSELSGLWSNIPKIAGVYTVSVAIYYLYDDYTVTKTFENKLTINEITSITIQTTRDDIDLTNLYQSNSSLANSITSNYISSDGTSLAFVNANGQEVSTITYFNEATNSFEEIAMTLDNFDIKFYKDGVEVDEADVKNSGDYELAISLKDKYNTGYSTESMTFTQLFTIHPKPMN